VNRKLRRSAWPCCAQETDSTITSQFGAPHFLTHLTSP
jgi:hypothetical protein